MAGLVSYYNQIPRIKTIKTNFIINPVAGSNPADVSPISITNVRGQVAFQITSGDNNYTSSFSVTGGFGDFPQDYTQNFYYNGSSAQNCTVNQISVNIIEVITPVADAGGRRYVLEFKPVQSIGPTIQQTTLNVLGNNSLFITMTKQNIIQGF
jgi:hypothetical protein